MEETTRSEIEVRREGSVTPSVKGKGRKKQRNPALWKKNVQKKALYTSKCLPKLPDCHHKDRKDLHCSKVTLQDVRKFHNMFYPRKMDYSSVKIEQDNMILKYTLTESPKRQRARGERKQVTKTWHKYYIPVTKHGETKQYQICQKTFLSILNISKKRVQRLCRMHFETGASPKETRGGDRRSQAHTEQRKSVKSFIEALVPIESHYCRNTQTNKQYLDSNLTIAELHKLYNSSRSEEGLKVKYEYFRNIFVKEYNISFESPAVDACSKCLQYEERCKSDRNTREIEIEFECHKRRANAFFGLLKRDEENTITFSFDCQKNLVLPKIPDQATYYSRQLYLYNFTICEGTSNAPQTLENTFIYTWTEADSHKGSCEIASAVYHRLTSTELGGIEVIRLFADGCGGQNKNTIMICMLMKLLHDVPTNIREIQLIFPVPGHSFIPPDRVFGRIEKELKKISTISSPEQYYKIFEKYGTVLKIGRDFNVYNWKAATGEIVRKPNNWHFQFSVSKRFIITRGKTPTADILVRGEPGYNTDVGIARKVLKPNRKVAEINPVQIAVGIPVKQTKRDDINKLLRLHYGEDWQTLPALLFYKNIIFADCETDNDNVSEDENEGGPMRDVNDSCV